MARKRFKVIVVQYDASIHVKAGLARISVLPGQPSHYMR